MKFRKLALVAGMLVGLTSMAGAASAQTKIYIVNEAQVMAESKLGKAQEAQLVQDANNAVTQLGLKTLKSEVDTEAAALQPQTNALTPEGLAANPTLKARVDGLNKKYSELVQKSSALDQGVEQQRTANTMRFNYVLVRAVDAVAKEVGADVVLSYGSALYNKDSVDISKQVVARLDATVPTIDALNAALPKPPAPAAGAAPGGG